MSGRLTARGALSTDTRDGRLTLRAAGVKTDLTVPYLGVALDGDITADVTLTGGRPQVRATATLPSGVVNLSATQGTATQGTAGWTGNLTGTVARGGGTLTANVTAGAAGLNGSVTAARYPLQALGQDVRLAGQVTLGGQTFGADLTAGNEMGEARVEAQGVSRTFCPPWSAWSPCGPPGRATGCAPSSTGWTWRASRSPPASRAA